MRIMVLIVGLLCACLSSAQNDSGAAVRVRVINQANGAAIAGAVVTLSGQTSDSLSGRTGPTGVFEGHACSSGTLMLTVAKHGYRMAGGGIMGKMVELKSGSDTEITAEMMPLGVLAGRVLDQYGDPVRGAIVRTERKFSAPGFDIAFHSDWSATTDDRGEYRLTGVASGTYFLVAEFNTKDADRTLPGRRAFQWPLMGGVSFYPTGPSIDQAQQVEVAAGTSARLNDLRITIARSVTIRGRIAPPSVPRSFVNLQRSDRLALHSPGNLIRPPDADGSFAIEALPGDYTLSAEAPNGLHSKPVTLELRDKNIANLELELGSPAFRISGRFLIDSSEAVDFSKLGLTLGQPVKIAQDGSFEANLANGHLPYVLYGLPPGWFIKHVAVGGRPLEGGVLDLNEGTNEVIFTLSDRGARVEVSVQGARSPLDAVMVVLLPESGILPTADRLLGGQPDASGKVVIGGVPPGSYRVFTLDASNLAVLFGSNVLLGKYRNLAPLIVVAEGEKKTFMVPVMKIPQQ